MIQPTISTPGILFGSGQMVSGGAALEQVALVESILSAAVVVEEELALRHLHSDLFV